jgi:hypothetical protein
MADKNDYPSLDDPNAYVMYRYIPSQIAAIIFVAAFGLATLGHVFQLVRKKTWYFIPLVVGCVCGYIDTILSDIVDSLCPCSRGRGIPWPLHFAQRRLGSSSVRHAVAAYPRRTRPVRRVYIYYSWSYHPPGRWGTVRPGAAKVAHEDVCYWRCNQLLDSECR